MTKIIETHNISKVYKMGNNIVNALQSVSISINKGEYVAFMGPSGSGKSTLMNIVGCLDSPTDGTYMLNNQMVSDMTENELDQKLAGLKEELFNLRFQLATGQLENPMRINDVKKTIARIKTIQREREIKAQQA